MIRILLLIVIAILLLVSFYLKKHAVNMSKVLAGSKSPEPLEIIFSTFIKTSFALALLGIVFVFFNQTVLSLIYIAVVMLASATFSIHLSKNIT